MRSIYDNFASRLNIIGLSPITLVVFALLLIAPSFIQDEYIMHLLAICLLYGTMAMAFDLSSGFIGVANWGFAGLMGLGGYTSAILLVRVGLTPWLGIIAGGLLAALLGLIIGALTLRMDSLFTGIFSWFVGLVLMALASALVWLTRGALGFSTPLFFDTAWARPYVYVILVICLATFIALRLMTRSNIGLAFKALGQDAEAARFSGINPMKYRIINFTVSCFIAGLCGGFYAHYFGVLTPDLLRTQNTLEIMAMAFIGGRGSIWGPLLAAFIMLPVFNYLTFLMEFKLIIYGVLLIAVMILYPSGISGFLIQLDRIAKIKFRYILDKVIHKKSDISGGESSQN